jgi:hypothetical protein
LFIIELLTHRRLLKYRWIDGFIFNDCLIERRNIRVVLFYDRGNGDLSIRFQSLQAIPPLGGATSQSSHLFSADDEWENAPFQVYAYTNYIHIRRKHSRKQAHVHNRTRRFTEEELSRTLQWQATALGQGRAMGRGDGGCTQEP